MITPTKTHKNSPEPTRTHKNPQEPMPATSCISRRLEGM